MSLGEALEALAFEQDQCAKLRQDAIALQMQVTHARQSSAALQQQLDDCGQRIHRLQRSEVCKEMEELRRQHRADRVALGAAHADHVASVRALMSERLAQATRRAAREEYMEEQSSDPVQVQKLRHDAIALQMELDAAWQSNNALEQRLAEADRQRREAEGRVAGELVRLGSRHAEHTAAVRAMMRDVLAAADGRVAARERAARAAADQQVRLAVAQWEEDFAGRVHALEQALGDERAKNSRLQCENERLVGLQAKTQAALDESRDGLDGHESVAEARARQERELQEERQRLQLLDQELRVERLLLERDMPKVTAILAEAEDQRRRHVCDLSDIHHAHLKEVEGLERRRADWVDPAKYREQAERVEWYEGQCAHLRRRLADATADHADGGLCSAAQAKDRALASVQWRCEQLERRLAVALHQVEQHEATAGPREQHLLPAKAQKYRSDPLRGAPVASSPTSSSRTLSIRSHVTQAPSYAAP